MSRSTTQLHRRFSASATHCCAVNRRAALVLVLFLSLLATGATPRRDVIVIPLPKHPGPLRFIVTGDAGTGNQHLKTGIAAVTKKFDVDAILLVGDNVYPCGVTSIDDPQWKNITVNFGEVTIPIYPILGNHDYGDPTPINGKTVICGNPSPQSQVRETGRLAHWVFPSRNYMLQAPWLDIVMIDTQPIASEFDQPFLGSETLQTEIDWIESAFVRAGDGWRIAVGHHTIYSSGVHGVSNNRDQRHLRADLLPVLLKDKVDLYICGHDHDAELIGNLTVRHHQPVFLIAGDGAHSEAMQERHRPDEPPTIFPPKFPPAPLVGFTLLEVTPRKLSMTFYDGVGNRRSDTYTMTR